MGLVEDNRRQNRLLNGGVRLLRFTAADIFQAPESVIKSGALGDIAARVVSLTLTT